MRVITATNKDSQSAPPPLQIYECGETIGDFYFKGDAMISEFLRIGYIISGSGFITTEGITHKIQAGDTYIITPGTHYYYNSDKSSPMTKLWLHFEGTLIQDILDFYCLTEKSMLFKSPESYEVMSKIHKLCLKYNDPHTLISETNMLLFNLLEILFQSAFPKTDYTGIEETLKKYIDINTSKNLSIDDLTLISNLSKDHTTRIFKQYTGYTPHQYILNRKIELSKLYLKTTSCDLERLAYELGFCDAAHFSYAFTQRAGMRPSKYKKLIDNQYDFSPIYSS